MSSRRRETPAGRPKATLFCPDCGHESAVDGDWIVRDEGVRRYACPACGATVARRPAGRTTPGR